MRSAFITTWLLKCAVLYGIVALTTTFVSDGHVLCRTTVHL